MVVNLRQGCLNLLITRLARIHIANFPEIGHGPDGNIEAPAGYFRRFQGLLNDGQGGWINLDRLMACRLVNAVDI